MILQNYFPETRSPQPEFMDCFPLPQAAYIHIPFCRRRCYYCDFAISVVGDKLRGESSQTIAEYLQFLCQEIQQSTNLGKPLETIFFGGGTPSLLDGSQLEVILKTLEQKFGINPKAEISMEVDPATFDLAQLQDYQRAGVNRFSLGVQSFQDHLLTLAGRSHRRKDVFHAVDLIHQAHINNWSLDLISGLPQQTLADWQNSLETAIKLSPQHISSYDLIVEDGTPFAKQYQPGDQPLPDDRTTADMYVLAQEMLTKAGYEHYEISNYSRSGKQCRHNRVYWQGESYYGFGMGAASYLNGQRFTRPRTRSSYYQWLEDSCVIDTLILTKDELFLETLMLGLRLQEGLNIQQLSAKFGTELAAWTIENLQPYTQRGWVELTDQQISLNDPQGFLFSNEILSTLFSLKM